LKNGAILDGRTGSMINSYWLNFVCLTKRQLESELVSLAKPKLAGAITKDQQAKIGWRPKMVLKNRAILDGRTGSMISIASG
jgi:hypothetical protein